jgi:hypothetical protein
MLLAAALAVPSSAEAGVYTVWACTSGPGALLPAPTDGGWVPYARGVSASAASNECRAGGNTPHYSLWAWFPSAMPLGSALGFAFEAPPNTVIDQLVLYRSAVPTPAAAGQSPRAYRLYRDAPQRVGDSLLEECSPNAVQACSNVGTSSTPFHASNRFARTQVNARRLYALIECENLGGSCASPTSSSNPVLYVFNAQVGLLDPHEPSWSEQPTGSLFAGGTLAGEVAVRYAGSDRGGGIASVGVVADGVLVATVPVQGGSVDCREPYHRSVPCPLAAEGSFAFDTNVLANGAHTVQVALIDAGGNRALSEPRQIVTRNGSIPNGTGATAAARIVTWTGGRRRIRPRTVTRLDYGEARTLRGRLTSEQGAPIGGAVIDVSERVSRPGSRSRARGTVTTDADGRFAYRARGGPSRDVRFAYRAFSLDPEYATTANFRVRVHAGIAFDVTPRRVGAGGSIRFEGRLLGGPGRGGVQLTLYSLERSRSRKSRLRVPVEVVRTDRRGRFGFRYRFRGVSGSHRFRFQARLKAQRQYPYAPAGSRVVAVTVQG